MTTALLEQSVATAGRESPRQFLHRPLLGPMIRRRGLAIALVVGCGLQAGLVAAGLPAMDCPVPLLFHVPCPGCGLTRACVDVFTGRFAEAARLHVFAYFAVIAGAILLVSIFLTNSARGRFADVVERIEKRTAVSGVLLAALFVYWTIRLFYSPARLLP